MRRATFNGDASAGRNIMPTPMSYDVTVANQTGEPAMANVEITPGKLVLKQGSTTLTFDKQTGKATLQQKILL